MAVRTCVSVFLRDAIAAAAAGVRHKSWNREFFRTSDVKRFPPIYSDREFDLPYNKQ